MSDPNQAEGTNPEPVQQREHAHDSPLKQLAVTMSGASLDMHDTEPPGASGDSVRAGHEPDRFLARSVLYVPVLVVSVVVVAFATVTTLFTILVHKPAIDESANVAAVADSRSNINDRFAKISSTDPNAPVKQPRLEYLKQQATEGDRDPPYLRSKRPIEAPGMTYEIYPEDLRPARYIDPTFKRKILVESAWLDDKKSVARIPIDEAMVALIERHKLTIRKDPVKLAATSEGRAKLSNAGRGGPSQPGTPAGAAALPGNASTVPH